MPENNFYQKNENQIKDVGEAENRLYTLLADKKRRKHSEVYHVIYALVVSLIGFIAIDGRVTEFVASPIAVLAFFAYPAMYVYSLLYSALPLKILPTVLPIVAYGVRVALFPGKNEGFMSVALTITGFFMCVVTAGILFTAITKKQTKLRCFTAVSLCVAFFVLAAGAVYLVYSEGGINIPSLVERLDGGIENYSAKIGHEFKKIFEDDSVREKMATAIPELSGKSSEKSAAFFSSHIKQYLYVLKGIIPGLFALVCMAYGFLFTGIFSIVAKFQNLPVYVCVMDHSWSYRLPSSCITVFDITLVFAVVSSLFGLPQTMALTVTNLLIVLLPHVLISTLKAINFFVTAKVHSPALGRLLTAIIAFAVLMFAGAWGLLFLCTLGVSLSEYKRRIELDAMSAKIHCDEEFINVLENSKDLKEAEEMLRNIPTHFPGDRENTGFGIFPDFDDDENREVDMDGAETNDDEIGKTAKTDKDEENENDEKNDTSKKE